MSRLQWNGKNCVNPPEGWDVAALELEVPND